MSTRREFLTQTTLASLMAAAAPLVEAAGTSTAPRLMTRGVRARRPSAHPVASSSVLGAHPSGSRQGPNLDVLPAPDRLVIARVLDPDPERRYPTCRDFVRALCAAGGDDLVLADTQPLESRAPLTSSVPISRIRCRSPSGWAAACRR